MSDRPEPKIVEPLDKDEHAFVLETLRQEAMELFTQQRAIADKGARALALGATVLTGFAAYGVAGKATGHELLLRAIPVAVALIAIELMQNFIAEDGMARARMAIEDALDRYLNVPVLVYDKHVRLRTGVNATAAVVGAVFILLYLGVVYLTQWPDAPPSTHEIKSAGDIVRVARGATALTGIALFVVIVVIVREQIRRRTPLTIQIPARRADSEARAAEPQP